MVMTFLPLETRARDVSHFCTGLMFALTPLGIMFTSLAAPFLMRHVPLATAVTLYTLQGLFCIGFGW